MSELYNHSLYINKNIPFLISHYIREYDLSKANISILYTKEIINKDQYTYLYNCPRMERQYTVGNLCTNDYIKKELESGFLECRKAFFEMNNINDSDVLNIRKDAIMLIDKRAQYTKINDYLDFRNKNNYTSYYRFGDGIEFYYFYNQINDIEDFAVKGISDSNLMYHKDYFLDFLLFIAQSVQLEPISNVLGYINAFYEKYIQRKLDVGYYRSFNQESCYEFLVNNLFYTYNLTQIDDKYKDQVDIMCNLNKLRDLIAFFNMVQLENK